MKKILLKNATIYTGYENKVLYNTDVLIIDNKIEKVCKYIKDPDARLINCSNKFITPGLINIHAHLFGTGKPSKTTKTNSKAQKRLIKFVHTPLGKLVIRYIVKQNGKKALMGGVTTMRTSGDLVYSDIWLRNKHFRRVPSLLVPGPAITCSIGHGAGTFAVTSDDPLKLRELVVENYKKGVDYIKTCTTGGVMDAKVKGEPGIVKMSKEQLEAIVDEAHKCGLYVASHTESSKGVSLDVECGVDFIEHGSPYTPEEKEVMKKNNTKFTLTLMPSVAFCELPPSETMCNDLTQYNARVLTNNIIKCGKQAMTDGIPFGLGTDAACPFAFQHLAYKEMVYAEKMLGISKGKALELMTINNAKLIGVDNKVGSIEEGKIADLLILSNDPMKDLESFYKLDFIIHNGNAFKQRKYPQFWLYEKTMRNFKCLPEYELLK